MCGPVRIRSHATHDQTCIENTFIVKTVYSGIFTNIKGHSPTFTNVQGHLGTLRYIEAYSGIIEAYRDIFSHIHNSV